MLLLVRVLPAFAIVVALGIISFACSAIFRSSRLRTLLLPALALGEPLLRLHGIIIVGRLSIFRQGLRPVLLRAALPVIDALRLLGIICFVYVAIFSSPLLRVLAAFRLRALLLVRIIGVRPVITLLPVIAIPLEALAVLPSFPVLLAGIATLFP